MDVLINELHKIQEKYGYIPEEEILLIADKKNIPKAEIYGVISFYSMFYTKPMPKNIIRICKSVSCNLNKAAGLISFVSDNLKLDGDGISSDKKFYLETVECLGHCGNGPVVIINDKIYEEVTVGKLSKLLSEAAVGGRENG